MKAMRSEASRMMAIGHSSNNPLTFRGVAGTIESFSGGRIFKRCSGGRSEDGKAKLQFRAQTFNIFNCVQFGNRGETQGNSSFGVVSSQANLPKLVQFALRLGI